MRGVGGGAVVVIAIGGMLLLGGMASGTGPDRDERVVAEAPEETVQVMLELDQPAYRLGEPILMKLTLTNDNPHEPVELQFSSAQRYDFVVTTNQEKMWRWSADKLFAMMLGQERIKPGASLPYTATWDQRDSAGAPVVPGSYAIVGIVTTSPEMISEPVIVEIQAERGALVE